MGQMTYDELVDQVQDAAGDVLAEKVRAGLSAAYQAGFDDAASIDGESIQAGLEAEAEQGQADHVPAGDISAETSVMDEAFDPLAYIHAGHGQPNTLCGRPIDHSIQFFLIGDPNLNFVTCPKCKDVLRKMAAEN